MIAIGKPPEHPESSPGARAFGATIRGRRIGAAMTLRMCAELMNVSMTTLSAYEQGTRDMPEHDRLAFEAAVFSRGHKQGFGGGA